MPSTVYKGDLTEVSFGHETGLQLTHNFGSSTFAFAHQSTDAAADTSTLRLTGGATAAPIDSGLLSMPIGMMVGVRLSIIGGGNFSADDAAATGKTFTVVKHEVSSASSYTELTVTPALSTAATPVSSTTNDALHFHSFTLPSVDVNMGVTDNATTSAERVLTDQFLGLAATVTLPETKVDLKRYHVVGLGRDVAVQVPGRFLNEGGSFEVNMHNPRWLYYCLGMEAVDIGTDYDALTTPTSPTLAAATQVGASTITISGAVTFDSDSTAPSAGDYIIIKDTNTADVITYDAATSDTFGTVSDPEVNYFDKTQRGEIRRIVAIVGTTVFLDDALLFPHASGTQVRFARFTATNADGSPNRQDGGNLQTPIKRVIYSRSTVPSFAMEVSVRRRDSDGNTDDVVDGGLLDTKQLTRVFRGCKVKDFSLTADTDAALRLNVNFDSALCYTDTGRFEGTPGDRYDTHRMFEDTANTAVARKEAGIERGTQKPYMFYNGVIELAGVRVGQVVSFTLNGSTGVQQFYTINGSPVADSATDQVPFAGSRNASVAVEGKTEYSVDMEIIVDDPVFYHHMRRAVDFPASSANMVRLSFTKAGSGATRERIDILLDDYVITEAPLPIPEDKGPIRAPLKILPKAIRVVSTDTLFHC